MRRFFRCKFIHRSRIQLITIFLLAFELFAWVVYISNSPLKYLESKQPPWAHEAPGNGSYPFRSFNTFARNTFGDNSSSAALVHSVAPHAAVSMNRSSFEITMLVSGNLGNRMFQYASLLGIAKWNGLVPIYSRSSRLQDIFQVTHITEKSHRTFTSVNEDNFASFDEKFQNLPPRNTILYQYFQSWKYFHFIRDVVRKEFSFKPNLQSSAKMLLQKHATELGNRTKIGVHVRRGDMLTPYSVKRGYHTAPASYLHKAMTYMRHKHPDAVFIVVTDDPAWCAVQFKSSSDCFIMGQEKAEVHLALLALCDHVIMTVGTFGWWGGYLCGGDVVYYWDAKECLHSPPLIAELIKPQDFFLPSWIPLTG